MLKKSSKCELVYRGPPGGGIERYFGFSRTHKREENGKFNDSNSGILSIHESQLTNMQEFTNSRTNLSIFTNSRTIFRLFTNHERNRFHEFMNNFLSFSRHHKRKKAVSSLHEHRWGGPLYTNEVNDRKMT